MTVISKSFTESNFASVLKEYQYNLNVGDIVAGTIFNQEYQGFIVDIGTNIAGYLPVEEVSLLYFMHDDKKYLKKITNITREFFLLAYNKESQQLILSIKRLEYIRAWKRIKQIKNEDIILNLPMTNKNKGGIITVLEGIKGFIPNSHLGLMITTVFEENTFIKCKLLLADEKYNQLILSHKKAVLSIVASQLKIGKTVNGKITKIEDYGVFIIVYGITSLLHISEIGDKNIDNIKQIFKIGDSITVKILHIDMKQGRISVSQRSIKQ
uniref:Small ribosomal subunit protein bS1c n=1 Tax=Eucheuma denticulatum TaxID=305493 RepID=A0A8E7PGB9_9FLOR|nr:30S ribosomal protein S1 [Eucheuma denticulatum]